jgi:hypothetical protein
VARLCVAQGPAEGDCRVVRDRDQEIWDSAEFREFTNRRGFDMICLDSAGFAEFMKADYKDNGKALRSLGLAK